MVSGQSFGSSAVRLAYITSMCSVQCFCGGHSLRLAFGSFFYPHPSPLNSSTVNQCDRCLVPLAWGLMAGGRRFASHGDVTLSRGWPCHRWKPLNIPGTHLHSAMQLLSGLFFLLFLVTTPPWSKFLSSNSLWSCTLSKMMSFIMVQ